jgi:alpha-1,6-mannosyltransferase
MTVDATASLSSRRWPRASRPALVRASLGYSALVAMFAVSLLLCMGAASGVSFLVPSVHLRLPSWVAGVLPHLGTLLTERSLVLTLVALSLGYAVVLVCRPALSPRAVIAAIAAFHALFLLAPPLLSTDIFSYIAYGRLGAVHGLSPYVHGPIAVPHDPVYRYVGPFWAKTPSAYGPLFTLPSYALALLGPAASLWGFKLIAALSSLVMVRIVWSCAKRLGHDPVRAVALVGLNPLLLVYAVGGGHNDMLMLMLAMLGVLLVVSGREAAGAAGVIASAAVKVSSLVVLPYMLVAAARRRRVLAGVVGSAVVIGLVALAAFGGDAVRFVSVLQRNQQLVSTNSSISDITALLGPGARAGARTVSLVVLAMVLPYLLWRVWRRGMDWIAASGWALLTFAYTTSFLLGWYTVWPLPFAVLTRDRRLLAATLFLQVLFVVHRFPGYVR